MFHVELAPLGGIFGPLKSDLGVFWPFRGTDLILGKNKNANFSKSPHGPIFKFFVVIREVILQKMAPILAPVNIFFGFDPYRQYFLIDCRTRVSRNIFQLTVARGCPGVFSN